MSNPYVILGIPETATEKDIKIALKSKVSLFCGKDLNQKDIEGNYLFQRYNEAAKLLLNSESRKEIDRILNQEKEYTSLVPQETRPSIKVDTREDYISYLNIELFKNNTFGKITKSQKETTSVVLENLYLLVGEDNSTIFVWQDYDRYYRNYLFRADEYIHKYRLRAVFTNQTVANQEITNLDRDFTTKFFDGIIFEAGGIKSYVVPACKIIPPDLIIDCKRISTNDLADLQNAIQYASREHPEVLKESFKTKTIGNRI